MTKKHFEAIATLLSQWRASHKYTLPVEVYGDLITQLADYLQTQNPHFDRIKFLIATDYLKMEKIS